MANLTPVQVATVASAAGFTGAALEMAVAIALAESGGNPKAVNTNSDKWKSRDRGLWQINDHYHAEVSDAQAFDPNQAAKAAYRISNGGKSWSAWATYKNGSANAQMSRAKMAVAQLGDFAGGGSVDYGGGDFAADPSLIGSALTLAKTFAQVGSTWIKAAQWLADPHNWLRVVEVGGGLVLVTVAVAMLGRTGAGPIADGVKAVASAPGKAAKAAAKVI